MLQATERSCGRTKDPVRHRETWLWNDVSKRVSGKPKLQKEYKQGNTSKEKYLKRKRLGGLPTMSNEKQDSKDLETTC